jgi:thioredoxin 1
MAEKLNSGNFEDAIKDGIVLIDFYADWCGPCKMIAPIIEQLAEEVTDAKVVKVDTEESPEIAMRFGIRSIPTFILLKDGEVVNKQIGAVPDKKFFLDMIENAR